MGIKNIHVLLIIASIILFLCFGFWALSHNYTAWGYGSLIISIALIIYCVQFIKKMKAL
ncbi:MAG: hypothetical protein HQL14_04725 [Candidatus Omnitrophica bacterium]|nr:hypothetical protein [Candidatus Omnitrophota bacterium]